MVSSIIDRPKLLINFFCWINVDEGLTKIVQSFSVIRVLVC